MDDTGTRIRVSLEMPSFPSSAGYCWVSRTPVRLCSLQCRATIPLHGLDDLHPLLHAMQQKGIASQHSFKTR